MNKKILFRIWNKKEKRMLEDIHICPQYGWLVMSDNDALSEICGRVPEDDLIWMQYTGLTDKNGKKIFEEDIVKCKLIDQIRKNNKWVNKVTYENYEVIYSKEDLGFRFKDEWMTIWKFDNCELEVIGKIFDKEESE